MQYTHSETVPSKPIVPVAPLLTGDLPRPLEDALAAWQALPLKQRPGQLARYLLEAFPVDLAAVFIVTPRGLRRSSGVLRHVGVATFQPPDRQEAALWRDLRRVAVDALEQRMPLSLPGERRWGSFIFIPLITAQDQDRGVIVLGNFGADVAASIGDALGRSAHIIAAALPEPTKPPQSLDLGAVIDATDDGVLIVDAGYTILRLNPAFTQITGWDERVVGQQCREVIRCHDEQDRAFCGTSRCPLAVAQTVPHALPLARTLTHIDFQGHRTEQVSLGAAPIKQERGTTAFALLLHDAAPLAEVMRERDKFLSDISHELRNRMNPILGFIDLVASGQVGRIATRQREHLSYAHTSAIELMEYIQNRLFLSRNETNPSLLNPDLVDITLLLAEVEQHLTLEAESAQVRLVRGIAQKLPNLRGDRFRLRQALLNLTMNAIKFTPAGGEVRLQAQRDGKMLLITVSDTGIGIAVEDQAHIFERDFKSARKALSGKSNGGLGLAAAQAIVRQHGGSIWFTSVVNVGTTFYIQLPLS